MAKSERKRTTDSPEPARHRWPLCLFIGIATCRFLIPTEAAAQGETLWIALLAWAGLGWVNWTERHASPQRGTVTFDLVDVALLLLIAGHVFSSWVVFDGGGDRRVAITMCWEWAGLWATWRIGRRITGPLRVNALRDWFFALTVGLAALGVWQHYVFYPTESAHYRELRQAESQLSEPGGDRDELLEIRRELAAMGVPNEEPARTLWENRLLNSSEPFGLYGLANTFGGHLAFALLISAPIFVAMIRGNRSIGPAAIVAAGGLLIVLSLVLTKSRTAWVGSGVGLGVLLVGLRFRVAALAPWKAVAATIGGLALLSALAVGATVSGALDDEVIGEAPKSVAVRLNYWAGALRVLSERPVLGTGPANFRSYYRQVKSPDASEDIASPHNLLLDVWVSGGMLSALGLFLLVSALAAVVVRIASDAKSDARTPSDNAPPPDGKESPENYAPLTGSLLIYGIGVPAAVTAGGGLLLTTSLDSRIIAVGFLAAAMLLVLRGANVPLSDSRSLWPWVAGTVALLIHLLGADGIEFPAVVQTMLIGLVAVGAASNVKWELRTPRIFPKAAAATAAAIALAGVVFALRPIVTGTVATAHARNLIAIGSPPARVLESYDDAAAADPLSLAPLLDTARYSTTLAQSRPNEKRWSAEARQRWQMYLQADPRSAAGWLEYAELLIASRLWTKESDRLKAAGAYREVGEALENAVSLDPTDARFRARIAFAWDDFGSAKQAGKHAAAALAQDERNRANGHLEQYLPDGILSRLKDFVQPALDSLPPSGQE
ncbi:O-antigen ligase family protein [Stratiformator vulcanicus]|uniref:O-Antigen ligase n=1 Tax=Stratiformator vulcanicus TaxID=2527980 RepID=A0A517R5P3_9PLAN|nr:O-antigen ligase family protein [Stratiformator vulcanicus]QDT39179.1 O-Antigen ligase [Stratiformator vulcanicus]